VLAHHLQVIAIVEGVAGHGESIIPIMQQSLRNCHHSLKFSRCRQGENSEACQLYPFVEFGLGNGFFLGGTMRQLRKYRLQIIARYIH
jgi:hypothetical protein